MRSPWTNGLHKGWHASADTPATTGTVSGERCARRERPRCKRARTPQRLAEEAAGAPRSFGNASAEQIEEEHTDSRAAMGPRGAGPINGEGGNAINSKRLRSVARYGAKESPALSKRVSGRASCISPVFAVRALRQMLRHPFQTRATTGTRLLRITLSPGELGHPFCRDTPTETTSARHVAGIPPVSVPTTVPFARAWWRSLPTPLLVTSEQKPRLSPRR